MDNGKNAIQKSKHNGDGGIGNWKEHGRRTMRDHGLDGEVNEYRRIGA